MAGQVVGYIGQFTRSDLPEVNARSIGVLRKCGFSTVGEGRCIAAGGHEVEGLIFALDDG